MPTYYRKVIRIAAEDSPNVRMARARLAHGLPSTGPGSFVIPGILPYDEYRHRRATWDPIAQCIGLDAQFYEGAEILMYPPAWLNRAAQLHIDIVSSGANSKRQALAIGIDPAEGGDKTAMCAVDKLGLIELVSKRTPDTNVIIGEAIAFIKRHNLTDYSRVAFDRGGGGKQHADRLRSMGMKVRSIGFGEPVSLDPKRGITLLEERLDTREERYAYVNRRAEMYGELRILLDPGIVGSGFAIPREYHELRRQLAPIPLLYDPEGRLRMLPKNKRSPNSEEKTLVELLGCSPDEADSLVLAIHAMNHKASKHTAGAMS